MKEQVSGHLARVAGKRIADLVLTLAIGFVMSPVLLLIALAVKVSSTGPIVFKQVRVGRNGRPFEALKFRTMCANAEERLVEVLSSDAERRQEYETYHKLKDDPRVTRLGRWLRRHGLDELPQLWNVLLGDMSLVGPRPYLPKEIERMGTVASSILEARPGITGTWQVGGRNRISFAERVEMEASYVQNWTWRLDLLILLRTVRVVIAGSES